MSPAKKVLCKGDGGVQSHEWRGTLAVLLRRGRLWQCTTWDLGLVTCTTQHLRAKHTVHSCGFSSLRLSRGLEGTEKVTLSSSSRHCGSSQHPSVSRKHPSHADGHVGRVSHPPVGKLTQCAAFDLNTTTTTSATTGSTTATTTSTATATTTATAPPPVQQPPPLSSATATTTTATATATAKWTGPRLCWPAGLLRGTGGVCECGVIQNPAAQRILSPIRLTPQRLHERGGRKRAPP